MRQLFFALLITMAVKTTHAQIFYVIGPVFMSGSIGAAIMPEHGFLPGKAFKFYPTINKYDFTGLKMRVELYDVRDSLKLTAIPCSQTEINNKSEFTGQTGTAKVGEYFQNLFSQSGIVLDSAASDTLKVYLEALDARLIGFGSITAHGLCQMQMRYKNISKTYCNDITDKDPHSPIGKNAFVTRKTATRVIASAGIREVIEQFFVDLKAERSAAGN
ncbi:hypothetical protein A3860_28320 [Niastella vici]|uniref:Uncharacterized protein n=1 Tax=Niastella vici TaxID=1703345 RepID=A0A1V9FW58_9BACT|nr:hypothetical protein [Niastella vici]OQP62599.1 hypothetical protein A3860_28320 [Niastella vici]